MSTVSFSIRVVVVALAVLLASLGGITAWNYSRECKPPDVGPELRGVLVLPPKEHSLLHLGACR